MRDELARFKSHTSCLLTRHGSSAAPRYREIGRRFDPGDTTYSAERFWCYPFDLALSWRSLGFYRRRTQSNFRVRGGYLCDDRQIAFRTKLAARIRVDN